VAVRPIVLYPDPILLRPCEPVVAFDDELKQLAADMFETMYSSTGVGLAANQVGVPLQLLVIDASAGSDPDARRVACNPEIVEEDGAQTGEEGCLSFPGISEKVRRPARILIRCQDLDGNPAEIEAEELEARVWCHEIDHLRGTTLLDRVSSLKRSLLKKGIQKSIRAGTWE
jgi:peptide deformylase